MKDEKVQVTVAWSDLLTMLHLCGACYSLIPETDKNGELKVHLSLRRN